MRVHRDHRARRARRLGVAALAVLLVAGASAAGGAQPPQPEPASRLAEVRERIRKLTEGLHRTRAAHDRGAAALRDVEVRGARLARELARVEAEVAGATRRLEDLETRRRALRDGMQAQLAALSLQVRARYAMGRQDRLKLMLNQEDPAALGRVLAYHDYFGRERARRIEALRRTLEKIAALTERVEAQRHELEALGARTRAAREAVAGERAERKRILDGIAAQLANRKQRLGRLRQDERELAGLVEQLRRELADIPVHIASGKSFPAMRGRLPWPARGPVRKRFGTLRAGSNLTWQGLLIGAGRGSDVRAVHRGRVAFADWLRGYGLLLIIDHGGGFMSLYGHNETLEREVGDWVDAGDRVASVGDSGGRATAGLYFEIRRAGSAVNPRRWMSRRPG